MIAVAMLTLASACTQTATVGADADNQVIAAIMSRRSIRHYKPEPVPRELMNRIVECGINAPSGMNRQPWEIRVVDNSAMLDTISKLQLQMLDSTRRAQMESQPGFRNIFRNAPTVAFIACPADGGHLDCGMLCQNMMPHSRSASGRAAWAAPSVSSRPTRRAFSLSSWAFRLNISCSWPSASAIPTRLPRPSLATLRKPDM